MTETYLERKSVSLDCDTFYWNDILGDVRNMPTGHGACFYFTDNGDKPVFSYIKTESRYVRIFIACCISCGFDMC